MKKGIKNLLLEPYRIFFAFGSLFAVLGVGGWFTYLHLLDHQILFPFVKIPPTQLHSHLMIYGVLGFYVFGFLLTAFPRFTEQALPSNGEVLILFFTLLVGQVCFLLGGLWERSWLYPAWVAESLAYLMLLTRLIGWYARHANRRADRQPLFIISAVGLGSVGAICGYLYYLLGWDFAFYLIGIELGAYGFLLLLVVSVTYRVVPFFTSRMVPNYQIRRGRWTLPLVLALVLLRIVSASLFSDQTSGFLLSRFADLGLLLVLLREWLGWRPAQAKVNPLLYLLFLGLAWILVFLGFSGAELWSYFREAVIPPLWKTPALHAFFIGSLGTLLVAISTRVVRGHGGLPLVPDRWVLMAILLMQAAALWRVVTPYWEWEWDSLWLRNYWSGLLWCLAFGIWAVRYIPVMLSPKLES